ncbi:RNA polymerase sigma factor [Paenibacillus dendritiformis C454]|uniref:RNA polymerase sigma factor n=1 Tax=Paenibacillus dendritiformis C454 TaxID=1131935 RepID=H3SE42_9BACL|nr:RNA polymerase sigma factor [Paenibacillus dendritiformis C454]
MTGLFAAIDVFIKQLTLLVSCVKNNAFPQGNAQSRNTLH